jgi:invasion protein IalB
MFVSVKTIARLLAAAGALAIASQAYAATKKDRESDAPAKPALVGTYGDWSVYQSANGKNRICYALATPKDRAPPDLKRDAGYAFISERPGERVRNEISFVMGYELGGAEAEKPAKESKDKKRSDAKDRKPKAEAAAGPSAAVGEAEFDLLPKGSNLWVKNPAQESQLIDEMRKGAQLKIKVAARRGGATVDSYSLVGFSQAIDRALKDCPGS